MAGNKQTFHRYLFDDFYYVYPHISHLLSLCCFFLWQKHVSHVNSRRLSTLNVSNCLFFGDFFLIFQIFSLHMFLKLLVTRHSLVRAKGEVFVLLYVCLFGQRFLDNPRADSRQSSHAGVLWFRMCLLPFWGLAAPGGRKKGQMKFSLLWESMGNFCILAVFERYLSNACTDLHQILFV